MAMRLGQSVSGACPPRPGVAFAGGGGGGGGVLLKSYVTRLPKLSGFNAAITLDPSGPIQRPTLKGIPGGVFSGESGPPTRAAGCHAAESFCVENPLTPACARIVGSDAGNPKQSGSMYSALVTLSPGRGASSRWNQSFPYRTWRKIASALGEFTSPSSIDDPAATQRPSATYFLIFAKSAG